jgi:uncharacterized protein YgbK (DUF1537 family)
VVFFILSDDLTGAAGVASMVDHSRAIVVNLDRFEPALAEEFGCIALNVEMRERSEAEAARRLALALEVVGENPVAVRMDSALRGHIRMLVGAMAQRGDVLVTDTIPEYGRRTTSGETLLGPQRGDIESVLAPIRTASRDRRIEVADSETYADIDELAVRCIAEGLIPIDPGPLVSSVARARLRLGPTAAQGTGPGARTVAFVVGTRDPRTLAQISYMKSIGVPAQKPRIKDPGETDVFAFSVEKDRALVTEGFLESLAGYDALVLSGGATANFVLARSGFSYLASGVQVQPLVSTSTVRGGLYDGKRVVLKGGFIGDEKTYKTISDWLRKE